jgi:hypothetical protein
MNNLKINFIIKICLWKVFLFWVEKLSQICLAFVKGDKWFMLAHPEFCKARNSQNKPGGEKY